MAFSAGAVFDGDERTFPLAARAPHGDTDWSGSGALVAQRAHFDHGYAQWSGGADVGQERSGYTLEVRGAGAFADTVHIFAPDDQAFFCVEPTTHVTDVINRRLFAPYGDMTALQTGEALDGVVTWRPQAL